MLAQATDVKVRDVTIKLHRAGQGQPVLFMHGAGGFSQWLPFFDALAEGHELFVPEHPGFGASDDPLWIRNVPDVSMFYLDFVEALGLEGAHLVGHSLGGWIGAEVLVRNQACFRSVTLLAPAGIRVEGVHSGDTFIWTHEEATRNLFHDQSFAERLLSQELSEDQTDVMLKNRFTATKLGWQPRWFNPDLEKWLHRITLPALVMWGDQDKVLPSAYAAAWQKQLPDARVVLLDKCGHLPHVEKAKEVSQTVREFLAGVGK
jgi:pimeloyl-ACP methyl ester carboxylesterase